MVKIFERADPYDIYAVACSPRASRLTSYDEKTLTRSRRVIVLGLPYQRGPLTRSLGQPCRFINLQYLEAASVK
jgi:hypothetical protein